MQKPLQRFIDRIGKTIYRNAVSCGCQSCKEGTEHGIEVFSKAHAQYLHTVHCEMGVKYRDKDKGIEQVKDLFGFK